MAEKKTGAIILAAGKSDSADGPGPMRKVGRTTMIQKEIDTLRQAGIRPIVVITGYQADILEHHIAHRARSSSAIKTTRNPRCLIPYVWGLNICRKRWTGCFCFLRIFRWCRPGPF